MGPQIGTLSKSFSETLHTLINHKGYTYSVFNLVYESNVASCRIWDALGFKRIGRVKGCGALRSYPDQLIDAIIYGRDLSPEGEDFVSEERFDKIRYYLKHGQYPAGADRAEKSRLRSAATHYKLILAQNGQPERLMLKDKEVVSDVQRQYQIARDEHLKGHGGINKTTAGIAEKYHWVRIKETVSQVIKNCTECSKDVTKQQATARAEGQRRMAAAARAQAVAGARQSQSAISMGNRPESSPAPSIGQPTSGVHADGQDQHSLPLADFQTHLVDYQVPVDPRLTTSYGDFSSPTSQHLLGSQSSPTGPPDYGNREAARALEALQQRQRDEDFELQQNAAQHTADGDADERMLLDANEEDASSRVLQAELMNAGFGRGDHHGEGESEFGSQGLVGSVDGKWN